MFCKHLLIYIYQFKSALSRKFSPLALTSFRRPCLKPGAHTAILVGRFRFRWMFSAKTISDGICGLIYIATYANIIHLNINRPTKIAVCAPGLSKRRFCQYGRHSKIGITNFDGILYHSARLLRKQKTYVLSYVLKITTN
jgi:hypothetical protein